MLAVAERARFTRLTEAAPLLSADRTAERGAADLAREIRDDIAVIEKRLKVVVERRSSISRLRGDWWKRGRSARISLAVLRFLSGKAKNRWPADKRNLAFQFHTI
jgi:hypothetical protein